MTKTTLDRYSNIILLRTFLVAALYMVLNLNTSAVSKEQCAQEYQAKFNELINQENSSAKNLAEKVLGHSFQKLAYAHNVFAHGTKEELKDIEARVNKYISESKKKTMSASEVMKQLKEFNDPYRNSLTRAQSDKFSTKNASKKKLDALILFSRSLDKKYHIEDYEKDALLKFKFETKKSKVRGWRLFVGDIAKNFYQRRFKDRDNNLLDVDKKFSDKKVSDYDKEVTEAIEALKVEILELAKGLSKECHQFLKPVLSTNGMCNLSDPFDSPTNKLILNTESILSKMKDPKAIHTDNPISVHYLGAQFKVNKCDIIPNPDKKGTYSVKMAMDFKYIPGADSRDWSMTLFGGNKINIVNDEAARENPKSNETFSTFSEDMTFKDVNLTDKQLDLPLSFEFQNKNGGQIKMFTIGDTNYKRDFNGNGSQYNIDCTAPNRPAPPTAPVLPEVVVPAIKAIYVLEHVNEENTITLTLTKDGEPADFTSEELLNSKINWTLPDELICDESDEETRGLVCAISSSIDKPTKVNYELIEHNISPDKADPPTPGEVDLIVTQVVEQPEIGITVGMKNDIPNLKTILTATVTNAGDNPEINWTLNPGKTEEKKTGDSIDVALLGKTEFTVCVKKVCRDGTVDNKVSIKVTNDGENKLTDESVKLIATPEGDKFKNLKGDYSWTCDGEECSGSNNKIEVKRKDKPYNVYATLKVGSQEIKSNEFKVNKLEKDKDKDDDKKKKDDDDCGDEEDEEGGDPFSSKVKKGCKPKEESGPVFEPKYMPPMQQPLILPPSQPYITPGFN